MRVILLFTLVTVMFVPCLAQQLADENFSPPITSPAYAQGKGPLVLIDGGHNNFHTADGRYLPFARLLRRDGYQVRSTAGKFTKEALAAARILVISNAIGDENVGNWTNPTSPAFDIEEIEIIENWVSQGGSLFLVADHMPMGGAAQSLAAAFDVKFYNGFAMDTTNTTGPPDMFSAANGTLHPSAITRGRNTEEEISEVASFTGQAFELPDHATPLITMGASVVQLLPDTAWQFHDGTPTVQARGWAQGAFLNHGKGKVVLFGEAAMFSAQLAGSSRFPMGMNHPKAHQNPQFLLNIIHWLDNLI